MTSYDKARSDFEALERIAELNDQVELDSQREDLMRNPNKRFAARMYVDAIDLWFMEHGIKPGAEKIAEKYFN